MGHTEKRTQVRGTFRFKASERVLSGEDTHGVQIVRRGQRLLQGNAF
jgi:hypothetical protein